MILNRYFLKSIFSYTLTISLIFILIIVSSRSIQYLEQASRGEISPEVVFSVVLFRLPEFLELILPLGFFLSIILSLGKLRAESEFVIMEQAGFNLLRVYGLLSIPALIICLSLFYFSTVLSPNLESKVTGLLEVKTLSDRFKSLTPGEFHKLDDEITIFARGREKDQLVDVFLNMDRSKINSKNVIVAKKFKVEDGLRSSLKFEDGYSYSKKEEDEFMTVQFSKLSIMDSPLITKEKEFNSRTEGNGSALIWSISICLMTILSIFISVPISKISPRKGRYSRVLPGLLVFSTYTALLLSFKGNEMIELTSLLTVHFLFLLLALVLNLFFLRSIK